MTEHPAKDCTAAEIAIFEQIAIGQDRGHLLTSVARLVAMGLVVACRGGWEVPIPIHVQWCSWCSENITDEQLEEGPDSPAELLAALKGLLAYVEDKGDAHGFHTAHESDVERARAAISRAEQGQ